MQAQEVRAQRARAEAEAARAQALAAVEASKVREVAAALGPETIRDIARAGPELQVCGAGDRFGEDGIVGAGAESDHEGVAEMKHYGLTIAPILHYPELCDRKR